MHKLNELCSLVHVSSTFYNVYTKHTKKSIFLLITKDESTEYKLQTNIFSPIISISYNIWSHAEQSSKPKMAATKIKTDGSS